ncbi:MAG: hypothetical protein AAFS07_03920 [Pseudomonadota bacterium]
MKHPLAVPVLLFVLAAPAWAEAPAESVETPPAIERFGEIRDMLDEAAEERRRARDGEATIIDQVTRSTPEERAERLLSQAFDVISDTEVTALQRATAAARTRIDEAREEIAKLREEALFAPEERSFWEQMQGRDDRAGIAARIAALEAEIADDEALIASNRAAFVAAMAAIGATVDDAQADLLLNGVTGGDILAIAAAHDVVGDIAAELRRVVAESGEEVTAARRYYTLHTTLIALLAHAQELFIDKVDAVYLPRLDAIEEEVKKAEADTKRLLRDNPTPAQRRVLEANAESQALTRRAAALYRMLLERQRDEVARRLFETRRDLAVADNTLRTVDASFQLLEVMRAATLEFEALEAMEAPGFDMLFENEELRREFESLSDRLRGPSS